MELKKDKGNIKILAIFVIILLIIVTAIFVFYQSHTKENSVQQNEPYEYFPLYAADGTMGVVDRQGNEVIKPEYTDVYIPNLSKDVFICFNNEQYTLLNKKGEEIFKEFDEISPMIISDETLEMEKNTLVYKKNGAYGLVDLSEKTLTDAIYEEIKTLENKPGYILVKKDGLYGVLDAKGNTVIDAKYYSIKSDEYCSETDGYDKTGYIISEKTDSGILYGYVDYRGKVLVSPKYESITRALEYEEDTVYLIVMQNGKKGVLRNKKQIIKNKFQSINYYNMSNIFIVNKNGKYGFYNAEGKEILSPQYTSYSIAGNYISVEKNGSAELYDMHGNLVNRDRYKSIIETDNPDFFIAESGNGYYSIISKDIQIDDKYTNITYAFENYFIFTNEEGKSGVLDAYSGIEIEPEYDYIIVTGTVNALEARKENMVDIYSEKIEKVASISEGVVENIGTNYLVVYSNSEMQYFNKAGEPVTNAEVYPDLSLYAIQKDGKFGFVDKTGKVVVDCQYDIVTELNEYGYAGICQEGKWGVLDSKGKEIVVPTYEIQLVDTDGIHCLELQK